MERCPACRSRLGETPICPRCGCDFTLALCAEKQAQSLLRRAVQAWCKGDREYAAACASGSQALKYGRLAKAVSAMLQRPSGLIADPCAVKDNPLNGQEL